MQYYGTVYRSDELKTGVSKKGFEWKVKRLIILLDGSNGNRIPVDFWGDDAEFAHNLAPGTSIKFMVELKGDEYNGKFYVKLQGKSLEVVGKDKPMTSAAQQQLPIENYKSDDDLPF